jgi:hypothetical protein
VCFLRISEQTAIISLYTSTTNTTGTALALNSGLHDVKLASITQRICCRNLRYYRVTHACLYYYEQCETECKLPSTIHHEIGHQPLARHDKVTAVWINIPQYFRTHKRTRSIIRLFALKSSYLRCYVMLQRSLIPLDTPARFRFLSDKRNAFA